MSEQQKITYQIAQTHVLQAIINYLETKPYNEVNGLLQTLVNTTRQFNPGNIEAAIQELSAQEAPASPPVEETPAQVETTVTES